MSSFDDDAALRLATLRSRQSLTMDEQEEIIELEQAHRQHRLQHPNFDLSAVVVHQHHNNKSSSTEKAPLPSTEQTDAGGFDHMTHEDSDEHNSKNHRPVDSSSSSPSSSYKNYFSSVVQSVSDHLPSKESIDNAAKAGWFWTSVAVGTAAPSVLGKGLGIVSDGFDHWNWIISPSSSSSSSKSASASAIRTTANTDESSSDEKKNIVGTPCGGLILGALPVISEMMGSGNHLKVLHKELDAAGVQMGMVVSALFEEEMKGFGVEMVKFATHDEWRKEFGNDIQCRLIQVDDCTPNGLDFDQVDELLKEMHEEMDNKGRTVYCHCKAGKGRSYVITICYLIAYRNMSFDAACTLVRAKRHQVNPSKSQVGFVLEYYKRHMEKVGTAALDGGDSQK